MTVQRYAGAALLIAGLAILLSPTSPNHGLETATPADVRLSAPGGEVAQHLSKFLTFQTVGALEADNHVNDTEPFRSAHEFLKTSYPDIWERLEVTTVSDWSLLMLWKGQNRSLKPAALLSHLDVVPADASLWTHPPFGGKIVDGYIYGRGALDLKNNIIAIMEAVNQLVVEGWQPHRSLYLAFGHDEELGGTYGATKIVELLQSQGVQLEFVLDEGGIVISDGLPPLTRTPIALVGTAEKDYSVVEIEVSSDGGHAAMPPTDGSSVAATLARIITAIDSSPPPVQLQPPTTEFLRAVAEVAPVRGLKWLLQRAHTRLVGPVLGRLLAISPDTAALIRTTAAMTMLQAGHTHNVLPQSGKLSINFRHIPGHTEEQVLQYVRSKVRSKDASRVTVQRLDKRHSSSHISSSSGPHFKLLSRVIRETMAPPQGGILVAPYLVIGGTDSKLYSPLTNLIFRFEPVAISRGGGELGRIHGNDERIHEDALLTQVKFFLHFIRSAFSGPIE